MSVAPATYTPSTSKDDQCEAVAGTSREGKVVDDNSQDVMVENLSQKLERSDQSGPSASKHENSLHDVHNSHLDLSHLDCEHKYS